MIDETLKQIEIWKEKAAKYDNFSDRYVKIAKRIEDVETALCDIRAEIDPWTRMRTNSRVINSEIINIRKEIYEKIVKGTNVSTEWIMKVYPNLSHVESRNLMTALQKMPNIDKRKEGVKVTLFARMEK